MIADGRRIESEQVHGLDHRAPIHQIGAETALQLVAGIEPECRAPAISLEAVHHALERREAADRTPVDQGRTRDPSAPWKSLIDRTLSTTESTGAASSDAARNRVSMATKHRRDRRPWRGSVTVLSRAL